MNIDIYPDAWDLRYFQEIAATGNLSRAAERLGVGQPTLSLSLKRLEKLLKANLFLRRNRGLELTQAGRRLLRESNKLLDLWESVISETKKTETEIGGSFKLGCHPSVAIYSLPNVLRSLYLEYPRIEFQLVHNLSRIICEEVISGKIDFGVVVNPIRHPDLVIHKLMNDEVGFWKTSKGLEDVLIYNPALTQSQTLLTKLTRKKKFDRTITSENLEVIASLASAGAGIAILPQRVARALSTDLNQMEELPTYSDEITFVYRLDYPKTATSKVIINAIKGIRI